VAIACTTDTACVVLLLLFDNPHIAEVDRVAVVLEVEGARFLFVLATARSRPFQILATVIAKIIKPYLL